MDNLIDKGFINYFGMQRFGSSNVFLVEFYFFNVYLDSYAHHWA